MGDMLSLPQFLAQGAGRWPDEPWCRTPEESATRAEVYADARRAVGGLRAAGVAAGDHVVIVLPNSLDFVRAWFGVVLTGAVTIAVNPKAAPSELDAVVEETGARVVIAPADVAVPPSTTRLEVADLCSGEPAEPADCTPDQPAAYIQSSGSTGRPKFIILTHGMYTMAAEGYPFWLGLDHEDVLLTTLPLSHLNAQAYSTLGSYGCGAGLVLLPHFSAGTFWDTVRDTGATVFNAIGAMVEILMARKPSPLERQHRLRYCYSAPAPHQERHEEIEARFGFRLVIGYALSESPYGLISRVDEPTVYGSMGRPRQHPRLGVINEGRVVDPATGDDVPDGELGELWLRNPVTTPGYFGRPEESAAVRRDGWLRTGDLARRDEAGNYYFAGRTKEIIRRRGENLSPADVEVVLDAHPAVSSSAVIGVPSPLTEEDVKAYVMVRPGGKVTADELREWCETRLPPYKRPRYVEFVDSWPLTETQKIAKTRLTTERTDAEFDLDQAEARRG
jgi:crotonobetaine/carnitine-CoA ligase